MLHQFPVEWYNRAVKEVHVNYALILSGGSGTRLWPLSRRARPKHLISLAGGKPLLEQTLDRLDGLIPPENRYLITIPEQAPIVRDTARGKAVGIIIEPEGVNNLLPMALSTRLIAEKDPEASIAFLPADHNLTHPEKLREALALAYDVAMEGYIVTIGIPTRHPETNYGHVQKGEDIPGFKDRDYPVYKVKTFTEKPPQDVAQEFHSSDDWFWNGGIFIYSAWFMLELISREQPELFKLVNDLTETLIKTEASLENPVIDWESEEAISEAYKTLPAKLRTSIDYALMEKADRIATIPVEMGWSDLGGFSALADLIETVDDEGNRIAPGQGDEESRVLLPGCENVTVFPGRRAVICFECEDLIVVETPDAVLVLPRDKSKDVRDVVDRIKHEGWYDLL